MNTVNYQDVLLHFLQLYQSKNHKNKHQFVSESRVNIKGIIPYEPYQVTEVRKFNNLIMKK